MKNRKSGKVEEIEPHVRSPIAKEKIFKTKPFARQAAAAGVPDADLLEAIAQLRQGKGDDLGGHLWKKRISNNTRRVIVATRQSSHWIFMLLYDKQDKQALNSNELEAFKSLAKAFATFDSQTFESALKLGKLLEIRS